MTENVKNLEMCAESEVIVSYANERGIKSFLENLNVEGISSEISIFEVLDYAELAEDLLDKADIPKTERGGARFEFQLHNKQSSEVTTQDPCLQTIFLLTRGEKHWTVSSKKIWVFSRDEREEIGLTLTTDQLQHVITAHFRSLWIQNFKFQDLLGVTFDEIIESEDYQMYLQAQECDRQYASLCLQGKFGEEARQRFLYQ